MARLGRELRIRQGKGVFLLDTLAEIQLPSKMACNQMTITHVPKLRLLKPTDILAEDASWMETTARWRIDGARYFPFEELRSSGKLGVRNGN